MPPQLPQNPTPASPVPVVPPSPLPQKPYVATLSSFFTKLKNVLAQFTYVLTSLFGGLFNPAPQLEGTVISADPPYNEKPDFDFAGLLLRMLLIGGALMLLLPILVGTMVALIIIVILFGLLGLGALSSLFPSCMIGCLPSIFMLIFRGKTPREVPVRNFRVQDVKGTEHQIRMKGEIKRGNISPGDDVSIWGRWKSGTLFFHKAKNRRTNADIIIRRPLSAKILLCVFIFLLILFLLTSKR
jgi:hypothetical protein